MALAGPIPTSPTTTFQSSYAAPIASLPTSPLVVLSSTSSLLQLVHSPDSTPRRKFGALMPSATLLHRLTVTLEDPLSIEPISYT